MPTRGSNHVPTRGPNHVPTRGPETTRAPGGVLTVEVDLVEHVVEALRGARLAERRHDGANLVLRDEPVPVLVEQRERQPQLCNDQSVSQSVNSPCTVTVPSVFTHTQPSVVS